MDIFSFVVLSKAYLSFYLYIMIKYMCCKIFGYSNVHTFKYAYSDIAVDNWAYIDVAFFTQHASYCNTLKFGIPYAEHPLCMCVYCMCVYVCVYGWGGRENERHILCKREFLYRDFHVCHDRVVLYLGLTAFVCV